MEPIIACRNLSKTFNGIKAVDRLSLDVYPGEIYGLVGPDGAGKTTTMRLLSGALSLESGTATIGGIDVATQIDRTHELIGYMPQRFSLYGDLTVGENLRFFAELSGLQANAWRPRTLEILDFVGLGEFVNRRAEHLSGGMKQKLALATALVHQPQILLLDEPTGGVDPLTRQDFWQLILRLANQDQIAVLVSTPYMDEAARCTRLGFMHNGNLMVEGTPSQVTAPLKDRILEVIGSPRRTLKTTAATVDSVQDVQQFGRRIHLRIKPGTLDEVQATLPITLKSVGVRVERIAPVHPTLEDAFIYLLEHQAKNAAREAVS